PHYPRPPDPALRHSLPPRRSSDLPDQPVGQTSCSSKAFSTARVRSRTPSLLRMFDTWFLIVPSATPSELAISLLEKPPAIRRRIDRKSTRLNSSHVKSSYAVFCLK